MENKFNNVFELLAEAEKTCNGLIESELLQNWYLVNPMEYRLKDLQKQFAENRLRLVPKAKKTVEGWVYLEPAEHRPPEYGRYVMPSHCIYKDKVDAQKFIVGNRILGKITFEEE